MTSIHDMLEACLLEVELLDHPYEETKENNDVISSNDSQKASNQIDDYLPGPQLLTDISIPTEPNGKCMSLLYDAKSNDSSFLDSSSDSGIEQEDNSNSDIKTISLHDLTNTLDLTTSTCAQPTLNSPDEDTPASLTSPAKIDEFEDYFEFSDEQIATDDSASVDNSNSVHANAATNVPPSVSDYVDGKVCLICDIEFQSPIIAINHAKTNHLDIIDIDLSTKPPTAHNSTNQKRDANLEIRVENETIAEVELSVIENSFSNGFTPASHVQTQPLKLLPLPKKCKLSREKERNLKKIRRKLRNRETAQDARNRKKIYLENLEAQVKLFADENCKLQKQVEQLKAQMTTNNQN